MQPWLKRILRNRKRSCAIGLKTITKQELLDMKQLLRCYHIDYEHRTQITVKGHLVDLPHNGVLIINPKKGNKHA